jgi:hypothetical protein
MRRCSWLVAILSVPLVLANRLPVATGGADSPITWKKTVIDKVFRSEGVAVADVDRDGKMDILAGDVWYQAPAWKMQPFRKLGDYKDGAAGYSQNFACWADDLNGDGYADLIVIGFPGAPCHWYENPKGQPGMWPQHLIWKSACNETPQYLDLFQTGKRVLLMGTQPEGQMAWFAPGQDPTQPWQLHAVSEAGKKAPGTDRFSHGLGAGDVNGDGRLDVIVTGGWWEQPADALQATTPWQFHPANLGAPCADMFAQDLDGDGKPDVLSSSAHGYGIWAYLQRPGKEASEPAFLKQDLFPKLFSQSHAMHLVDINGDGLKDLVTGKRWWAHGPKGDVDPNHPAVIYWFEAKKGSDGAITFTPREIDNDSGIGTQFWVGDFNGDQWPDIVTANKKGVFLFEQVRGK